MVEEWEWECGGAGGRLCFYTNRNVGVNSRTFVEPLVVEISMARKPEEIRILIHLLLEEFLYQRAVLQKQHGAIGLPAESV